MTVLKPTDIAGLIVNEYKANGQQPSVSKTILFTSIALAESGGNTLAVNTAGNTPAGSRDRGLFQFNEYWNKDISDADAFDPVKATHWAYVKSDGFTDTSEWTNSKGLSQTNISSTGSKLDFSPNTELGAAIGNTAGVYIGGLGDDINASINQLPGGTTITNAVSTVSDALSSVTDWASGLGGLLSHLTSADWWKRIGIGALGIGIIILGLIAIFSKPIEQATKVAAVV